MSTRSRLGAALLTAIASLFVAGHGRCGETPYETWLDYNVAWQARENVRIFGDVGIRRNSEDPRWWKYVLRPNVAYDAGGWQVAAGIGNFYNDLAGALHVYELRPWQGLQLRWPSSRVRLGHLFRLEERFFFDTDDGNSIFRFRFRYQLSTRFTWSASETGRGWNSPLSIEVFLQLDDDAEERIGQQLRLTGGVERVFGPQWRLRVDLLWQKTARLLDLYSDNELYLRFRVFQSF